MSIPGISPALADKLDKLGLRNDADLLLHLPLRYEDETQVAAVADAHPGLTAQFDITVLFAEVALRPRRQLVVRAVDARSAQPSQRDELWLRLVNFYPSHQKMLSAGARLRVFGEVRMGFYGLEIVHPRCQKIDAATPLPQSLTPIYPTTAGLTQSALRRLIEGALKRADLSDTLPDAICQREKLAEFGRSIRFLHQPAPDVALNRLEERSHPAWRRIAFDELLAQQLSLRSAYAERHKRLAPALVGSGDLARRFLAQLPFTLTAAQQRVCREIAAELLLPQPMQRLLQGDVGSGKTVIAAYAMLIAAEAGWQAALMAPTEILAEQHYHKLSSWFNPLGIPLAWLSGGLKAKEKQQLATKIAAGQLRLVVGTHALIEEGIVFPQLGLAIVDEQHRFGVRQRLALKQKGEEAAKGAESASAAFSLQPISTLTPHQLTMSATPIPRTLAMSYYADLDVSVLDELPQGRTPVRTRLVSQTKREAVIQGVRTICRSGGQAYWVCPLIEESEALQLKTAEETFARLTEELPEVRVGLAHGRLKAQDKAAVMTAFANNEVQLLVATTVIEVGVDVPNASLMVIEHAERFGLAQLHQLRGRVGRGAAESTCILLYAQPLGATARARLKIIFESNDGFEIARRDLELRGPGEFIGSRQAGLPLLRFADLNDVALIERVRQVAEELLRDWPHCAAAHMRRWLAGREELLKA